MQLFNSAIVRASGALVCRGMGFAAVDVTVRYGLIRRPGDRFCLIDTGYGPRITSGARSRSLRLYNAVLKPQLIETQSPGAVLKAMGASVDDVDMIIVTHFHADHVARLNEFPLARIMASGTAVTSTLAMGWRQALHNGIFKELLPSDLARRVISVESRRVTAVHPLLGTGYDVFGDGSYFAVPLPGHADGHFGLFWTAGDAPTLYATDAAWSLTALQQARTPAVSRAVVFQDRRVGRATEGRLRAFMAAGGRVQLCHDLEPASCPQA